jgi:hypothetical protein
MGIFGRFGQVLRWNKDPIQQRLASLFILAGSSTPSEAFPIAATIERLVSEQGWSNDEAKERLAHAISLVRVQAPRAVYDNATQVWRAIVGLD